MSKHQVSWKNEYNRLKRDYRILSRRYNEQKERIELLEKENKSLSNSLEHLLGIQGDD